MKKAQANRLNYIEDTVLNNDDVVTDFTSRHPVFITIEDEKKYMSIENQTNATIMKAIEDNLAMLTDPSTRRQMETAYKKSYKNKPKAKLLEFYFLLTTPEDSENENDNM